MLDARDIATAMNWEFDTLVSNTPAGAPSAFQIELSQRYGLDYRLTFKLLPAELPT